MAMRGVPVVGRGDEDGVDFFHLEQLAVVGEVAGVRRLLPGLVDLLAVDVADGDHIDRRVLLELRHVVAAALAAADDTELHFVVGAEDAGVGERCGSARAAQQITSSDVGGHAEIIRFSGGD